MLDFKPEYCQLLKTQVEEEMQYLKRNGHTSRYPSSPCIFCMEMKDGWVCNRIEQLSQFLSSIMVQINGKKLDLISESPLPTKKTLMPLIGLSN